MSHKLLADAFKPVQAVAPTAGSPGTMTATAVSAAGFERCLFILNVGAITNTGTVDMYIQSATSSGGSYANTSLTGAALTQIADTGGGKLYTIDVPVPTARPYLKAVVVTGTAAAVNGVVAILYRGTNALPITQTIQESITI